MKSAALNTLEYTGMVTLSQYIGHKKIKIVERANAGGNPLFNFLADCLVGDFDTAKLCKPTKIMLLQYSELDGKPKYESRSGFTYLTSKPEKVYSSTTDSAGLVRYSFIISRDMLNGTEFNSIGLYTDTTNEPAEFAAFCKVEDLPEDELSASSVLLVDWELSITNKEKGGAV